MIIRAVKNWLGGLLMWLIEGVFMGRKLSPATIAVRRYKKAFKKFVKEAAVKRNSRRSHNG
jgi:hypothetical protein